MKNNTNISIEEIYTKKFFDYYNDANYTLYDIQEFYYPYYRIKSNCIFREKHKISIIEEIFLEAISCGIKDYKSLEQFLAIDKEIFEEVAGKLHIDWLFIETSSSLILTEKGKKILEDGAKLNSIENEEFINIDAITGESSNGHFTDENKNDTSKNKNRLKSQIPYPKNETLDRIINDKALQTILFEEIQRKDTKDKEIYEIKEIISTFKYHKKYFALFFKNKDNPQKVLIIKDGSPDDEMTNLINKIIQNGINLFDFSRDTKEEHKKLFEQENIYEYSEINNLTNGTQLSTYQHPKFFEYLLKNAKKEIIIISPWIKWEVIESKQEDIENALKQEVQITFFYGMGKKNDIDKKSKDFFLDMQDKYNDLFKFSTNNDINDHSKIIICDRDWMITTSFNWTSFKGDENREERKERGSFINVKSEVIKTIEVYIK